MAKKKTSKKSATAVPERYKPSMRVDASQTRGQKLVVGKSASFNVKGRVMEESIDTFDNPKGQKSYRIEIDKVSSPTKRRK
jgi:hypothetical protein